MEGKSDREPDRKPERKQDKSLPARCLLFYEGDERVLEVVAWMEKFYCRYHNTEDMDMADATTLTSAEILVRIQEFLRSSPRGERWNLLVVFFGHGNENQIFHHLTSEDLGRSLVQTYAEGQPEAEAHLLFTHCGAGEFRRQVDAIVGVHPKITTWTSAFNFHQNSFSTVQEGPEGTRITHNLDGESMISEMWDSPYDENVPTGIVPEKCRAQIDDIVSHAVQQVQPQYQEALEQNLTVAVTQFYREHLPTARNENIQPRDQRQQRGDPTSPQRGTSPHTQLQEQQAQRPPVALQKPPPATQEEGAEEEKHNHPGQSHARSPGRREGSGEGRRVAVAQTQEPDYTVEVMVGGLAILTLLGILYYHYKK